MSRSVDIGGRKLEVIASGTEPPTIVFESGAGRGADDWDAIRSLVSSEVSAFAYSRAGQGGSDPPLPENVIFDDGEVQVASAESRTADLVSVLDAANVAPPYVLVGHSIGGIYSRRFAARRPETVAGMVFVDSSHPDQVRRLREAISASEISKEARQIFFDTDPGPNVPVIESAAKTGPFGDVPIAVLSQDTTLPPVETEDAPPVEVQRVFGRVWPELQAEIAQLSTDSTHMIVEGSGHIVHESAPETVAAAIDDVIERWRARQRRSS